MRYSAWVLLFFALPLLAESNWNAITVSDTVVQFGQVTCYTQHEMVLTLQNNLSRPVQVESATFEENEFTTDLTAGTVPAKGSQNFHIYFESDQNVDYTDFLRIDVNAGSHPLIVEASAEAIYEDSYYDATQNLWGADLKSALHNTIKGHTEYGYGDLWNILSDTDEDPDNTNNVLLLYTGWSYAKSNHGGGASEWNREHVWAKSHGDFGTSAPAGTDVHHIRPTDVTVNSKRGNLDFDNGGTLYTDGDGPTECRYDNDSWEPRDAVKGDVARMMYYMAVRYEGDDTSYDLELVDYTPSTTSNEPVFGKESTLYEWHQNDPVDDWERRRNDRIYTNWQHNRNPFIDHPEFAARMPSISQVTLTTEPEIAVAPEDVQMDTMGYGKTALYSIAIANTGNAELNVTQIESTNPDFTVDPQNMTLSAETYDYTRISFTAPGTEGDYSTTIRIHSNDSDENIVEVPLSVYVSETVSVVGAPNVPHLFILAQNFPNPFNPTTTIRYQLAAAGQTELVIYNALGQKVRTLVNARQNAGSHTATFNAAGLPSGVYLYRLQAGGREQIRKMILMR